MKKKMFLRSLAASALAVATIAASPASAQPFDAQMLMQLLQQRGIQQPTMPPAMAQRQALAPVSDAALAQRFSAWPAAAGPFELERFRDGFSINGRRVLDPEGRIEQYALDRKTGDYAYLVETFPGQYVLKTARHQSGAPVAIATAMRQQGVWMAETATGERLAGSRMILQPRGLTVARDNVLFTWTAGVGTQSFAGPETHSLAAHQNGDIPATGWVLMEKRREAKQAQGGLLEGTSAGALIGSIGRIGAILGVNKADADFALYELATGRMLPVAIALEEKIAHFMSQCRQRNAWLAMCDRMDSMESVFMQDGWPNRQHYFWRVSWYRTEQGPVAVLMENNISRIEIVHLGTGQRATVFERALGIGNWSVRQTADGRLRVEAQLGLERAVMDDALQAFLKPQAPALVPVSAPAANLQ